MKNFKNILSVVSAVVLSTNVLSCGFSAIAEDSKAKTVKISFNITDDMTPAPKVDVTVFDDVTIDKEYFTIPKGGFEKEGYKFSGWTVDNIYGFLPGDTYIIPDGVEEVVFEPLWYDAFSDEKYNITYDIAYKGEEVERPKWLKDATAKVGEIVTPDYTEIKTDNAFTHGFILDDKYKLNFGYRFVMPEKDVVIKPQWFAVINFVFLAGDVDRINGSTIQTYPKNEGSSTELPDADRFSRSGFNLVGWLADYDNKVHKTGETVVCPGVDVTFTAVWEAKTYNVVFKQGNGGANIKVEGKTDTQIICPTPDVTVSGKYFAGWQDSDGKIYNAGDKYTILGALPGAGISLTAVWKDGEAPATTTTKAGTTTTTKAGTTTTTKAGTTTTTKAGTTTTTKATVTTTTAKPTVSTTTTEEISRIIGDANCDGEVNIADATAIIQAIGNKDKYGLSEQGEKNADCYNVGDGVTGLDALLIQQREAYLILEFPVFDPETYMKSLPMKTEIPQSILKENSNYKKNYIKDKTYKTKDSSGAEFEKKYSILLPEGYDDPENANKKYPVLYLNHGISSDNNSMIDDRYVGDLTANLASQGLIEEMIIVFPLVCTSPKNIPIGITKERIAAYEEGVDEITNVLKPLIEKEYRVKTGKENTAVAGFSMGARVALEMALKYPDEFGYVCSVAPAPGIVPMDFNNNINPKMSFRESLDGEENKNITTSAMKNEDLKFPKDKYPYLFILSGGSDDNIVGGKNVDTIVNAEIKNVPNYYHQLLLSNNQPHIFGEISGGKHDNSTFIPTICNFMVNIFKFDLPDPFELYDANMDGVINLADLVLIRQMIIDNGKYGTIVNNGK